MIEMAATALHVSDLDQSLRFWRDTLGMRDNFDTGWTSDRAVFDLSGAAGPTEVRMVNLADPAAPKEPPGPGQAAGVTLMQFRGDDVTGIRGRFQDPGTLHIAFWVDRFDERVAALSEAGYEQLGPVTQSVVGNNIRLVMFNDPDGFTLEMIAQ